MGGLARGRVRPDCKEGSRKRNRVAATTEGPVYIVLIVYNSATHEIGSEKSPPLCRAIKFTFSLFTRRS